MKYFKFLAVLSATLILGVTVQAQTWSPMPGGGYRSSNGITLTPMPGGGYRSSNGVTLTPMPGGGFRATQAPQIMPAPNNTGIPITTQPLPGGAWESLRNSRDSLW